MMRFFKGPLALAIVGLAVVLFPMLAIAWCFSCGVYVTYKIVDGSL